VASEEHSNECMVCIYSTHLACGKPEASNISSWSAVSTELNIYLLGGELGTESGILQVQPSSLTFNVVYRGVSNYRATAFYGQDFYACFQEPISKEWKLAKFLITTDPKQKGLVSLKLALQVDMTLLQDVTMSIGVSSPQVHGSSAFQYVYVLQTDPVPYEYMLISVISTDTSLSVVYFYTQGGSSSTPLPVAPPAMFLRKDPALLSDRDSFFLVKPFLEYGSIKWDLRKWDVLNGEGSGSYSLAVVGSWLQNIQTFMFYPDPEMPSGLRFMMSVFSESLTNPIAVDANFRNPLTTKVQYWPWNFDTYVRQIDTRRLSQTFVSPASVVLLSYDGWMGTATCV